MISHLLCRTDIILRDQPKRLRPAGEQRDQIALTADRGGKGNGGPPLTLLPMACDADADWCGSR